jgi:hypothetical protein
VGPEGERRRPVALIVTQTLNGAKALGYMDMSRPGVAAGPSWRRIGSRGSGRTDSQAVSVTLASYRRFD